MSDRAECKMCYFKSDDLDADGVCVHCVQESESCECPNCGETVHFVDKMGAAAYCNVSMKTIQGYLERSTFPPADLAFHRKPLWLLETIAFYQENRRPGIPGKPRKDAA